MKKEKKKLKKKKNEKWKKMKYDAALQIRHAHGTWFAICEACFGLPRLENARGRKKL
jgi:hypothetical protein